MDWENVRVFIQVVRNGSVSAAARASGMSQPALTKRIQALEASVSKKLLERSQRGVLPTREGILLFDSALPLLREWESLEETLKTSVLGPPSLSREIRLRIAASEHLCTEILPPLLSEVWHKTPWVKWNVFAGNSREIVREILERRARVGVFLTQLKHPRLTLTPLGRARFVLVCGPANLKLRGLARRWDLATLQRTYYIGSRVEDYRRPYPALQMLARLGLKPSLFFEANSLEVQKRMAMEALGYALLPRHMVERELKENRLLELRPPGEPLSWPVYWVEKKKQASAPQEDALLDQLKERLKSILAHS